MPFAFLGIKNDAAIYDVATCLSVVNGIAFEL